MPPGGEDWRLAVVLDLKPDEAVLGFEGGRRGRLPFSLMRWARKEIAIKKYGAAPKSPARCAGGWRRDSWWMRRLARKTLKNRIPSA